MSTLYTASGYQTTLYTQPLDTITVAQKRRRGDPCPEHPVLGLPAPFTIEPESEFAEEVNVVPRFLVPRNLIPLNWISPNTAGELFYHSDPIPALRICNNVLVATFGREDQLALIQSTTDAGLYGLLRLTPEIKIKQLSPALKQLETELPDWRKPLELLADEEDWDIEEWWGGTEDSLDILSNALKGAHVSPSTVQLRLTEVLKKTKSLTLVKGKSVTKSKSTGLSASTDATTIPEFGLAQLRQQYYSLLYTSKSSLGYFPKTSLSRARITFPTVGTSPTSRLDLLLCLENMLMLTEDCDEKYRGGIFDVAKVKKGQVGIRDDVTDEQLAVAIVPPKCFRDNEIKYVLKWLRSLSEEEGPVRSPEQEEMHLQKCIAELRARETELQIILLLEILSIKEKLSEEKKKEYEKMKKAADRKKRRQEKLSAGGNTSSNKRRKKVDHMVLLDLLVDRLCIWYMIDPDEEQKAAQQDPKDAKDRLKHFCTEIVLAHYFSRLPTICKEIRIKCSGTIRQIKDQATAFGNQEKLSQEETQETTSNTTEGLFGKSVFGKSVLGRPASLSRSLTAPAGGPHFETNDSAFSFSFNGGSQNLDLDLAAHVSQEKAAMRTSFRGGITDTKKTADNRVVEVANPRAKKRKFEDTNDEQLRDAIKNIAKPNRSAVAEEMLAASAQRMMITGRKPKTTIRNPFATTVQVAATPRKNSRFTNLLERGPDIPVPIEEEAIPSSSQVVPQSTVKRGVKRRSEEPDEVEATPSKAPRFDTDAYEKHERLELHKHRAFITKKPTWMFEGSSETRLASGFMDSISETPKKKQKSTITSRLEALKPKGIASPKPGTPVNDEETSIYQSLGWDDY
ncbi:hypothetical protein TWF694_001122 [Orbilia ellipsospora]|uniref:DNA replication regulator Sld3 C-terminal domain-containing protein n=1 Tax=Orbilia ellipsospora TaxID=2528407 RepID=A0AAV9XQR1_9PEZI